MKSTHKLFLSLGITKSAMSRMRQGAVAGLNRAKGKVRSIVPPQQAPAYTPPPPTGLASAPPPPAANFSGAAAPAAAAMAPSAFSQMGQGFSQMGQGARQVFGGLSSGIRNQAQAAGSAISSGFNRARSGIASGYGASNRFLQANPLAGIALGAGAGMGGMALLGQGQAAAPTASPAASPAAEPQLVSGAAPAPSSAASLPTIKDISQFGQASNPYGWVNAAGSGSSPNNLGGIFKRYMGTSFNAGSHLDQAKMQYLQQLQNKGLPLNAGSIYNRNLGYGGW